jgi:DNA-directed RNA polymerase specialized sigma24 family protein
MVEAAVPALRRYASILVGDKREQDDLVHACLLRSLDRLHRLRGSPNLKIWLFSTLHNVFVRQQRRRTTRPNATSLASGVVEQAGMSVDQDTRLACATLRVLYALPLVQRQVLILTSVGPDEAERIATYRKQRAVLKSAIAGSIGERAKLDV